MSEADTSLHQQNYIKKILKYWFPVLAYMGCITYVSSLSSPEEQLPTFIFPVNDKVIHATEYAILGMLCFRAFEKAAGSLGAIHAFSFALITATLFGVTDEFHQSFVPLRQADPSDVLADLIGATIGILIWQRIRLYYLQLIRSE